MAVTAFLVLTVSSLFAVIDPLGCIPFFSGLTAGMSRKQRRNTLFKALVVAFFVLAAFTAGGQYLLELFGITVPAFRIAGGVIFFGIGLDMLQSQPRRWRTGVRRAYKEDVDRSEEDNGGEDPSITPIAIPLLAGPGSITTVMVLVPQGPQKLGIPLVLAGVLAILLVTGLILWGADKVLRRVGSTGLHIIEKLMGLLVTVIAVQLVIDGLTPVVQQMVSGG